MTGGWIVEVEHEAGSLLFAARTEFPDEAEDIVRRLFAIPASREVFAARPATSDELDRMGVTQGKARGPL